MEKLVQTSLYISEYLGKKPSSKVTQAISCKL